MRLMTGLAGGLAAMVMLTGAARADFGAIAYSPSTGAYGYSYNYSTRGAAERAALGNCRENGAGCQSVLWFEKACGAVAAGANGWGSGWAASKKGAYKQAIASCSQYARQCKVIVWACSG